MTRRSRALLGIALALTVLGAVLVAVLPEIVRRVAVSQLAELTHRGVTLEDVDLNLFTGRLVLTGFRLAQREGPDAALDFQRLEVRVGLFSLLTRDVRVRELTLTGATVRVARTGPAEFDFSDLLALIPAGEPEQPAARTLTLERLTVSNAAILAHDRVTTPPAEWRIAGLRLEAAGITTRAGASPGRITVEARVNDAPLALQDGAVRLTPPMVAGHLTLEGFALALLQPYLQPAVGIGPRAGDLRLALTVDVALGEPGQTRSDVSGDVVLDAVELVQGERAEPAVAFERLAVRVKSTDLVARAVTLASVRLERLAARAARDAAGTIDLLALGRPGDPAGAPRREAPATPVRLVLEELAVVDSRLTFVDAAVTPATTLAVTGVSLEGRDLAWPGAGRIDLRAAADLAPLAPYLEPAAGLRPASGSTTVGLTVRYQAGGEALERLAIAGTVDVVDLRLLQSGQPVPFAILPRLAITIGEADLLSRTVTLARVELDGLDARAVRDARGIDVLGLARPASAGAAGRATGAAPVARVTVETLALRRATFAFRDDTHAPPTSLALSDVTASVRGLAWPGATPAAIEASMTLPARGRFSLNGRVTPLPLEVDVQTTLRDAAIEPYHAYIPLRARFGGSFNGDARWRIRVAEGTFTAESQGTSWIERLEIGAPGEPPAVRVERIQLDGIDFGWPTHARAERLAITRPEVNIERGADGSLNLRRLFTPEGVPATAAASPSDASPEPAGSSKPLLPLALDFGRLTIEEGYTRFLDRSTTPAFSQTLDRLAVTVDGLSSTPGQKATLLLQGVIGGEATLEVRGEIAPLGALYANLSGQLRDFSLPSVNPYADSLVAWLVRSGTLGIRFTAQIEQDTLTANNEIAFANLKVEPSGAADEVKNRLGLPLGLIVALVTDSRGGIAFNLPLSGPLSDLRAGLGDAIWAAVKNAIVNILASPFRAIGRLFQTDAKLAAPEITPLGFDAGSSAVTSPMGRHLTNVGDFLRKAPLVRLQLTPVTTAGDLAGLKAQQVTARVQQLQRERELADYAAAVLLEYLRVFPRLVPPESAEEQLAELRAHESVSDAGVAAFAARRLEAARAALVASEGIQPDRLAAGPSAVVDEPGAGRVEFQITY